MGKDIPEETGHGESLGCACEISDWAVQLTNTIQRVEQIEEIQGLEWLAALLRSALSKATQILEREIKPSCNIPVSSIHPVKSKNL